MEDKLKARREILKSHFGDVPSPMARSDQARGVPRPAWEAPPAAGAEVLDLPAVDPAVVVKADLAACIADRRSRRSFADSPLSLEELSFLLWATAALRDGPTGPAALRTVPSAGARHPLNTYVAAMNVGGLKQGIYRYLALSDKLVFVKAVDDLPGAVGEASCGQMWVGSAAAVICWAAAPYRSEWRYSADAAKLVLLDAGHICQNLYLAAESIGCGVCGVGAYRQEAADKLFDLDGVDEFVVYYSPIGKVDS